jgi:predicted DNA-binding transcriptional regulator AlpA
MAVKTATVEQHFTTKQLAPLIGYSVATLKYWRKMKTGGPAFCKKPGTKGAVRYRASAVNAWLKTQNKTPINLHD